MTNAGGPATAVNVRVFGGVGLFTDEPVSVGGPRQRRLLALLAIRVGSVATIDWLHENLWTDEDRPEAGAPALRTYVSRLRQSFPDGAKEWIETEASGYRLAAPSNAVEHQHFSELREAARVARAGEDPLSALSLLDTALGMWRGQPFRELEDLPWARAEIEQLEVDRLEMFEERWEAALALGRHTQITGELAAFTSEHALRERAARQHALALHRSGRTTEGLRVIDGFRRRLADESGLDPSPELRELETAMLRGDGSLDVETAGRPLRGYRLLEEIGSGAFAKVWRGTQPSVDREVAVKEIRSDLATQPEFIRRFEAEAHLVARIEHPYIVPLIDYWRDPDSAYLVMRWLKGGTLERRLDDGPLSVSETVRLARQIGGALSAAHAQGIVHRDVKTANILFDDLGNSYLSDFGIALEASRSSGPEAALSPGSPAYASPEQVRRERLGPEADIFSLGVVLHECLVGGLPFPAAASVDELVQLRLHHPFPSLGELRADVPGEISDAVARATSHDPRDRFSTVLEFVDALSRGLVGDSSEVRRNDAAHGEKIENPYLGLYAFDDADRFTFFGRESVVREMLGRLGEESVRSRCLVVVGPSGSGKSSVVRAGLVPQLREGALPGSADWFTTSMVPGPSVFEALEAALLRIAVNPPATLLDQLRDGPRGILRSVRRCLGSDDETVLLVIDQFEELFTNTRAAEAAEFLNALTVAIADPTSPVRVVITLRADYYHRPLEHGGFAPLLKETALDLTPLAAHELEQAIVGPADTVGVRFVPGLVAQIAAETNGEPSPLPLLQYALWDLFERRTGAELTTEDYERLGGISGALASQAETIYAACAPTERAAVRRLFGRLTNVLEASADLRRRVPIAELAQDTEASNVLDRFGAARLLAFDRDVESREPTVEVAHEALLREWPRLITWIEDDRAVLRTVQETGVAAGVWDEAGRVESDVYRGARLESARGLVDHHPERFDTTALEFLAESSAVADRERNEERATLVRLRRLVAVVGVALVAALVAGAVAWSAQQRAVSRTAEADLAAVVSRSAASAIDDPTLSVLLALEANRRSDTPETQQAVMHALGSSAAANRVAAYAALGDENCPGGSLAHDGDHEQVVVDGRLLRRSLDSGTVTDHGPAALSCVYWFGDEALDVRVELAPDFRTMWFGPFNGAFHHERTVEHPVQFLPFKFMSNGGIPGVEIRGDSTALVLVDGATGDRRWTTPAIGLVDYFGALGTSSDESLIAFGTGEFDRAEGDGLTVVVDASTGDVVHELNTPVPPSKLVVDDQRNELVVLTLDGSMRTFDLTTGEPIAEVVLNIGNDAYSLTLEADGSLTVLSSGQIQVVDRRLGVQETLADLRDVVWGANRAGRSAVIVTTSDRLEVLDLNGNALVAEAWPVPADAIVSIDDGVAAFIPQDPDGRVRPTVVDLTSGERSEIPLFDPTGSAFRPLLVWPYGPGILGLDATGRIGRWSEDGDVEILALEASPQAAVRDGDHLGVVLEHDDGATSVAQLSLAGGEVTLLYRVEIRSAVSVHPTPEGGMFVFDANGRLFSLDSSGSVVAETQTELKDVRTLSLDHANRRLVVVGFGDFQGVAVVEPDSGSVAEIVQGNGIASVGFVRNGELVVVVGFDGTVRLWDPETSTVAGLLWNGSGSRVAPSPWYDSTSESLWVSSSGLILNISLDPERWVERACEIAGRDLTQNEWDQFVPGAGDEVLSGCEDPA